MSNTLGDIRTFTSFRANLEAQNPTGNPAFSRGWKPTRELPKGHIVRSFHLEAQGRGLASPSLAFSPRPTLPTSNHRAPLPRTMSQAKQREEKGSSAAEPQPQPPCSSAATPSLTSPTPSLRRSISPSAATPPFQRSRSTVASSSATCTSSSTSESSPLSYFS